MDKKLRSEIETELKGISVVPTTGYDFTHDNPMYPRSFLLQAHSHLNTRLNTYINHNIDKIVVLKNSRPIEVK
jgi:hypothetical protein